MIDDKVRDNKVLRCPVCTNPIPLENDPQKHLAYYQLEDIAQNRLKIVVQKIVVQKYLTSQGNLIMNKEKTMSKGLRHGEIALIPTNAKPKGKKKEVTNYIVGHSETGHNHVLEAEIPFTVFEESMLIDFPTETKIVHQKTFDAHKTLVISPGIYKRYAMFEYDPFARVIREVAD